MPSVAADLFGRFIGKLRLLHPIAEADEAALQALPARVEALRAGTRLVSEGEIVSECRIVVDGYAFRHKMSRDGARQIMSFHLPGDILDVQHLWMDRADHGIQALTDIRLIRIPISALRDLVEERPALRRALWIDSLIDAAVFREWVLNVGRRDAKTRIAHMLCEFVARHEAAGIESPTHFTLPMTQEHIADATGLTPVHVNRMLRSLSDEGVIERSGRVIRIADWPRMTRTADFQPDYLHLGLQEPALAGVENRRGSAG